MTRLPHHRNARRGLSLLEVVVSLAILLFSVVAITHLISMGTDRALDAQREALGSTLAQRKLAEVVIGATPLSSTGYSAFDEDGLDNWQWKLEANQNSVNGLWNVQVSVKFDASEGNEGAEVTLGQMVLDPSLRGSSLDAPVAQNYNNNNSSNSDPSSSNNSSNSNSSNSTAPAAPAGGAPAGGRPTSGAPAGGRPTGGAPAGGRPTGGAPAGGRPTGGAPAGGAPAGGRPSGGAPAGGAPAGGAPAGGAPAGGAPAGGAPAGGAPAGRAGG